MPERTHQRGERAVRVLADGVRRDDEAVVGLERVGRDQRRDGRVPRALPARAGVRAPAARVLHHVGRAAVTRQTRSGSRPRPPTPRAARARRTGGGSPGFRCGGAAPRSCRRALRAPASPASEHPSGKRRPRCRGGRGDRQPLPGRHAHGRSRGQRDHRDEDQQTGVDGERRRLPNQLLGVGQHVAPAGQRRLDAEAKER